MGTDQNFLDPVEAYDRIAPVYRHLADRRKAYLDAVDRLVISRIPPSAESLLDVGGGDGTRTWRIAMEAGIKRVVLVEPSAGMRKATSNEAEIWPIRAEHLSETDQKFDVVICLWNVLGHIPSTAARVRTVSNLSRLLAPTGRIFIDVNHRYNTAAYGWVRTAVRWAYDRIKPDYRHGDVVVSWDVDGVRCSTRGHVFTDQEFRSLAVSAQLVVEEKIVLDYQDGRRRRLAVEGNLFYVLRHNVL